MLRALPVAAVVLCYTTVLARPLPDDVIPGQLGLNIHFTREEQGEVAQLAASGVKWIRHDLSWSHIEIEAGKYDFSEYDRLLEALDRHGIRAQLIFDYCNPLYDDNQSPHTDAGRAAFARYAAAAAKRYAGRGVVWEMWNEPNISPQWRPTVNVEDYIQLAIVTAEAVRKADPDAILVGPSVAGIDFEFLKPCFEAGLLEHFDAVSVHPYGQRNPEEHDEDLHALRRMVNASAPPSKRDMPILCTEWGFSDTWIGMSRDRQAKILARQWLFNLSHDLRMCIWYNWRDNGVDPKEPEDHFGLVEHEVVAGAKEPFKEKPAYRAAKALSSQLNGFRFNKRLWVGDARDWVLLFEKGDEVRMAVWTTAEGPRRVEIPASSGDFSAVNHLGEHVAGARADGGRLIIEAADAPLYLTPTTANDALLLAAAWPRAPAQLVAPAQDLFAHADWAAEIRNPLSSALRLQYVAPPPPPDSVEDPRVTIQPGGTARLRARLPMNRLAKPQPTIVTLDVDGLMQVSQRLELACSNPWSIHIRPLSPNELRVDVENPSKQEGWGRIEIFDADNPDRAKPLHRQAIGLSEGQWSQWMFVAAPQRDRHHIAVRISGNRDEQLDLPPERFVPIDLTPAKWKLTPEGDPEVASKHSIAAAPPPGHPLADDTPAATVSYEFAEGWKYVMLQPAGGPTPIEGEPHAIGLWVKGDGTGNFLRCRFRDASGQTFQPEGVRMDFVGWRYVEFPLTGMKAGFWGGELSGTVRYPIELDTLLLIDSAARLETSGAPTIAMPVFIYRQW